MSAVRDARTNAPARSEYCACHSDGWTRRHNDIQHLLTNALPLLYLDCTDCRIPEYGQSFYRRKGRTRRALSKHFRVKGLHSLVEAIVVGSLGSWDPKNDTVLRGLGISRPYSSIMKRLVVSNVIRWSRDIYVEHWDSLLKNIGGEKVTRRLARAKNTAPGPDGLRYRDLRRMDVGSRVMPIIFSRCLKEGRIPPSWKTSRTAGVKQGCALSPTVFNLGIEPIVRAAEREAGVLGVDVAAKKISNLAYVDDLVLMRRSAEALQRLLDRTGQRAVRRFIWTSASPVRGSRFTIQGESPPCLREGEPYSYLGVPFGFKTCQTPMEDLERLAEDKFRVLQTFLLPRLSLILRAGVVRKEPLKRIDRLVCDCGKRWLSLPRRASPEVLYIQQWQGGMGLLPLGDLVDILTFTHGFRLLHCKDPVVRSIAWSRLREVVRRRIGRLPTSEDCAKYLSGSMEENFGSLSSDFSSLFTQASRQITIGEREEEVRVPPGAIPVLERTLKNAARGAYLRTLWRKPDQGKVLLASSSSPSSNHFVDRGRYMRFCDWRFVYQAQLDVLPLNASPLLARGRKALPASRAWQLWHNGIQERLATAIGGRHGREQEMLRFNQTIPGYPQPVRPDLMLLDAGRDGVGSSARIIDVTVAFENTREALDEAQRRKEVKYAALAKHFEDQGFHSSVEAIVVGILGNWDMRNDIVLRGLGISRRYAETMKRLVVSHSNQRLWRVVEQETLGVNQTVPGYPQPVRLDLLLLDVGRDGVGSSARIIDVTVAFENTREALDEARRRKEVKYAALAKHFEDQGFHSSGEAIVIGSLGTWDPRNDVVLRGLGISRRIAESMKRLVVSHSIRWSRDIYVEYVSGHRQYEDGCGE
ncbi:hypothetical protein J437_LFUL019121 [Ladona fulva]|uniref:Reverse transcriptase domain-containing protein n=1 Tax=Ladona fulva TaxID=123851 RepID=A0A8K0KPU6_LADFU|nr:hypothetical protein J437_LFUL019121 [Ladona fulva]